MVCVATADWAMPGLPLFAERRLRRVSDIRHFWRIEPSTARYAEVQPPACCGASHKSVKSPCHSGSPRSSEPGSHKHRPLEYRCRARRLRPRPGMTGFYAKPRGGMREEHVRYSERHSASRCDGGCASMTQPRISRWRNHDEPRL